MTEPDVTLTDYALAIECGVFAFLLARASAPPGVRTWLVLFFASTGAASALGGTVHGFFLDEKSLGHAVLWPATLIAIGLTAVSGWAIGARLCLPASAVRIAVAAAMCLFTVYAGVVLLAIRDFWLAIAHYAPSLLFLLGCFAWAYREHRVGSLLWGVAALGLSLLAAGVQHLRIAVHPLYFNHNALYHVIQGVALFLFFRSAQAVALQPRLWRGEHGR